jgi:hypothetical protein
MACFSEYQVSNSYAAQKNGKDFFRKGVVTSTNVNATGDQMMAKFLTTLTLVI